MSESTGIEFSLKLSNLKTLHPDNMTDIYEKLAWAIARVIEPYSNLTSVADIRTTRVNIQLTEIWGDLHQISEAGLNRLETLGEAHQINKNDLYGYSRVFVIKLNKDGSPSLGGWSSWSTDGTYATSGECIYPMSSYGLTWVAYPWEPRSMLIRMGIIKGIIE